ncbi:MAG: hypothetical protein E6344_07845 [Clostridium sp.]|nr:hypothetical protein [Clostridium sp.]MDU7083591.1 hypothetical protein [Clostridium sp.]
MSKKAENSTLDIKKHDDCLIDDSNSSLVLQCSKIVCYNNSATIAKWALDNNTARLSISPSYGGNETCTLDLSTLNIDDGTQFILKALVVNNNLTSKVILEYNPDSNVTANFRLERTSSTLLLVFLGTTLNRYKNF